MSAKILDGFILAADIRKNLAAKIRSEGLALGLAVILVGDNSASKIYVRNKQKAAEEVGIDCKVIELSEQTSEKELKDLIFRLNQDDKIDGILLQLPLPRHLNSQEIIECIDCKKDVDGFSPYNAGLLQLKSPKAIVAATPKAALYMIKSVCDDLSGKNAVVIGRSNIVGRPMAMLLLNNDCTVTITHHKTKNLCEITKTADILVVACGQPKMVKADWVKDGAIVVDVGINSCEGKLCGDVDFEDVVKVASYISPVPKGVGPMTIAMLLENVYYARKMAKLEGI